MEQSTTAKSAAHLGVALHHESLQVAESHLSTTHLTLGEDSAGTGLHGAQQTTEERGGVG